MNQQGGMGLSDLITTLNNLVQAVFRINTTIGNALPQADSALTDTATGGSDILPGNPEKFLSITVNGVPYKIPLYNP